MEEGAINNTPESTLTNHGQVGNAGDASSLLQDLANWYAARSLPAPNFDEPKETSSLAKTSQEDQLEQRDPSEEPSTTDGTRSETFPSASHPQRFSSGEAINQQKISSFPSFPTHLDQGASSSLNAGTSQLEGSVEIYVEEPSPSGDFDYQSEPSPSGDFEYQSRGRERTLDENRALCAPLLQAVMKGDWPSAKAFIEKHTDCVRVPITHEQESALHIAAVTKHTGFIEELLKLMNPEDLELKTKRGVTALHIAAQTGVVRIAKLMLKKNNQLSLIGDGLESTPLHFAAIRGERNMVDYLFLDSVTPLLQLTTSQRIELLLGTVFAGLYDIALEILKKDPNLATEVDSPFHSTACGWTALKELARKPFAIGSERQLSFWKKLLNSWHKGMYHNALMRTYAHQLVEELWKMINCVVNDHMTLLVEAAEVGNVEFLIILIRSNPDLLWQVDSEKGSLFHVAIQYRQESVFNLIDQVGVMKENITNHITAGSGENMLHFAGKLAPANRLNTVSIAAVQMQWELLWFKKIKKIVPPSYVNIKDCDGFTPTEIFERSHAKLQDEGEKWMKQTANSCILVATLVATVVFAAAFTVPGGNDQTTGKPILLKNNWFTIFFLSDAIALVFSSTSILIFLSILTSRYGEEDIFKSIPLRLLFGLAALFVSIAGMVIAFGATCFLVYYSEAAWAPIVIIVLATIPITLFVLAHFQLWVDTIHSTYWSRFIFRSHKRKIF